MILVAHQPEYLPYLGFFAKVSLCDLFLVSDHLQYAAKDFQNRNYLRNHNGKTLITVPVLHAGKWDQPIQEVRIDNSCSWAKKHWMTLYHNYHRAPYFQLYASTLEHIYSQKWERLCDLNITLLRHLLNWLSINAQVELTSNFDLKERQTQLLIEMCQKVGADTFISGRGARDYVYPSLFDDAGIKHYFFDFVHPEYPQHRQTFVPNLSVLDLLFNVGPGAKDVIDEAVKMSSLSEVVRPAVAIAKAKASN